MPASRAPGASTFAQARMRLPSCARAKTRLRASTKDYGSNSVGVHALVFAGDWSKESCVRAISGAQTAGFDLIEIPMLDPASVDVEHTRQQLEEHGLKAACSLGLSDDADINSEDSDVVKRGEEALMTALRATDGIGAPYMVGVLMSALRKYPGPCSPGSRRNVVKSLQSVADAAADMGITLGLEVVNRYETNVINTAAQGVDLVADIGRDNVLVHLDTYHMNIEEFSMESAVRTCGDKLGYVHIGEAHRGYLGTGSVDFRSLFRALAEISYDGPITFESFSSSVVSKDLSNNLCVWRNLWDNGDDLAKHARQFMDTELRAAYCNKLFHAKIAQ